MAIRVFELAREIGVTSKVILDKCRAEDVELKNHMATLSAGLEATIREWFSGSATGTAVEAAEHVDLAKARAEASKHRRKRSKKEEEEQAIAAAQTAAQERAAAEAVEAPAEAVEPAAPTAVEPEAAPAAPQAEAAPVQAPEQAPPPAEPKPSPSPAPVAAHAEAVAAAEAPATKAPPPSGKQPVRAAGPQLVPRPAKLKGPRVVRVEKPDYVPVPPRRQGPSAPPTAAAAAQGLVRSKLVKPAVIGVEEEEGAGKKKAKRRSPRRKGGRSADSGEKLREWRERDLQERSQLLAAAGVGLRRHRASVAQKRHEAEEAGNGRQIEVEEPLTIKNISAATGIKAADFIRRLMQQGVKATVNQALDRSTAEAVALEYDIELVVKAAKTAEDLLLEKLQARPKGDLTARAPVVTFLGHVDHGKTSLLDRIRNTAVAEGEAGGITQHVGAYRYDKGDAHVVFLDTPGHEAFTAMRSRGANMTDVVVLVVAADDGVMPQTVEAISHAKAAKVPIVVALNKVDVPNANIQRALGQLAEHGLQPREWGGNVEVIQTSAVTGKGIDDLLTTLSLEAELLELKAEPDAPANGFVVEARMDPAIGAKASLLVLDGTLKVGDVVLAGGSFGRVRQIMDDRGRVLKQAGPAMPVSITGLSEVPQAGDRFYVTADLDKARQVAADRQQGLRAAELAYSPKRTLEDLLGKIKAGEVNQLSLILKADVQGSLEALMGSLGKLGDEEVKVQVLHRAVGGISTGDVMLAEASNAIIIGFNVVPDSAARRLAETKGVDIRLYRIIYDMIDDVRKALEEGLAPEIREETLGRAEVRQVFKVSRFGAVAGCIVTDGLVNRNAKVRITRDNIVIEDGRSLESLKRFKDDVREVRSGMECGLKLAGYEDIKEGDVLEFYQKVEVARKL